MVDKIYLTSKIKYFNIQDFKRRGKMIPFNKILDKIHLIFKLSDRHPSVLLPKRHVTFLYPRHSHSKSRRIAILSRKNNSFAIQRLRFVFPARRIPAQRIL